MSWTMELLREQFPFVQIGSLNLLNDSLLTSRTLDKEVVSTVLCEAILPELLNGLRFSVRVQMAISRLF